VSSTQSGARDSRRWPRPAKRLSRSAPGFRNLFAR